jgi:hypothetical protein
MEELTHMDWLFFSQQKLIENVDPNVSITYESTRDGGKSMIISGIDEKMIDKLTFLTNTDQNNNYLYLESFSVYVSGLVKPLEIPGINDIVLNIYRNSDIYSFIVGNKLHDPFNVVKNIKNTTFTGRTFGKFIDDYTSLIPYILSTSGRKKTFEVVLKCSREPLNYGNSNYIKPKKSVKIVNSKDNNDVDDVDDGDDDEY